MTIPAFHVEAKLHAFRKTQDGVVVSFVVSPIDMPQALALDPLGTRYVLAICAIDDDERPINPRAGAEPAPSPINREATAVSSEAAQSREDSKRGRTAGSIPATGAKERRPWETLSPQQQAGILCADKGFQAWVSAKTGWLDTQEDAADWLRTQLGIESRRELSNRPELIRAFNRIREQFMYESGRVPVPVR